MHREIKFRGYSHEHGWIHGDLLQYPDGKVYIMEHSDGESLSYEVDPDSVGQYTGLKTKGGTMIYEGDIIYMKASRQYNLKFFIEWHEGSWMIRTELTNITSTLRKNIVNMEWLDYIYKPKY